ncbi:SHOCT domain-containing protein [Saccharothrix sp. NRRL B-16314]|uniref:SHOCT domain-containing protein n=1 Tax=Saccharothrix sp. NRRL B-16314 TaxID=1463825 RepID=UPI0005242363|nr:SHOCT domain-containing protein [Saccharothrix sp. NRRL B-16314]
MVLYEGTDGWIGVEGTTLTILRTDNRDIGPRTLPFQALSRVTLREATRLRRGHIQLCFGTGVRVPKGADDVPNMIRFGYERREQFRALYEYLQGVVRTNVSTGVDMAAAYEAANDPLAVWQVAQARRQQDEHRQRIDKLARKIGPEAAARQDIMAAGIASATGERCWLVLKHLPGLLLGRELVVVVAECFLGNVLGTVVLTNQRVMFVNTKFSGDQVQVLRLGEIIAVSASVKLFKGALKVQTLRGAMEFSGLRIEDLQRLDESLRRVDGNVGSANQAASHGGRSVLDQIAQLAELHEAGVLSAAEFEAKKQQLLDRL